MESRSPIELLESFAQRTILVLGDVMLDEFTWGQVSRISPEAPVPVVEVLDETDRLGGAANVAANIKSLGGRPLTIGVIGQDDPAGRLMALCAEIEISPALLYRANRPTTLKTRIIAHSQQVVRTDREDRTPLSREINEVLATRFAESIGEAEAIVISDYDKGVVNRELLARVLPEAQRAQVPVFLDPKVHHADYYHPVTVLTPNQSEAELLSGKSIDDTASLEDAGQRLLERFECPYVLITRGERGMSLFGAGQVHHMPAAAREVFDVSGAGDTVIATLALAHAGGAGMEEAARLANKAAGIVVGKVGTATSTLEELLGTG